MEQIIPEPHRIYVAGPFTSETYLQHRQHLQAARNASIVLAGLGHWVHCPHEATDFLDGLHGYEWFLALDFTIIKYWSTALFLITPSPGATRELHYAESLDRTIFYDLSEVPRVVRPNDAHAGADPVSPIRRVGARRPNHPSGNPGPPLPPQGPSPTWRHHSHS